MNYLEQVFWEMNKVSYSTENIEKEIETIDNDENTKRIKIKSTILHITINGKTIEDMNLSYKQLAMIQEILKDDYTALWEELLYGSKTYFYLIYPKKKVLLPFI